MGAQPPEARGQLILFDSMTNEILYHLQPLPDGLRPSGGGGYGPSRMWFVVAGAEAEYAKNSLMKYECLFSHTYVYLATYISECNGFLHQTLIVSVNKGNNDHSLKSEFRINEILTNRFNFADFIGIINLKFGQIC